MSSKRKMWFTRDYQYTRSSIRIYQKYLEIRETPKPEYEKALFVSSYKRRICPSSIEYLIQDARVKAKIKKWIYCHMFRSSLITHIHMNGASAFHIQQQSRHKTLDVLKGYIRLGKEQRLKTYESYVSTISDTEVKQKPLEQPKLQEPQPKKKEPNPIQW